MVIKYIILTILLSQLSISCLTNTEIDNDVEVKKEVPVKIVTKEENNKGDLVIYSGRKESLIGPLINQFKSINGINVEVKYGTSTEIAALLMLEGSKTPADIFYAQDPGALGSVINMLQQLSLDSLEKIPVWAKSNDGKWIGVSGRARTLVYNTDNVNVSELPNNLYDLCDSKWKGRMGWAPTNSSFQTMITAMRKLWGEDKTMIWVKCMIANDIKIYPKNAPQVEAVGKGEIDIGLVNHYYLYKFILDAGEGDKFKAKNFHLNTGGPGSLVMVSPIGILNTAKNKDNAQQFIDFMISKIIQNYFADTIREYPLIEGAKTYQSLTPLSEITKANINLSDLADIQGSAKLLQEVGALPR